MGDSFVLRSFKLFQGQPGCLIGLVELFDTALCRPLRFEVFQNAGNFIAVHPVTAFIRSGIRGIVNFAARHNIFDNICDFTDLVVLGGRADIEGLVMNQVPGSLQSGDVCPGDVFDMHNRAPGRPVAFQINPAGGKARP